MKANLLMVVICGLPLGTGSLAYFYGGYWIYTLISVAVVLMALWGWAKLRSKNIEPRSDDAPKWDPANPEASLDAVFHYVLSEAVASIRWYWQRKKSKAFWSQVIRFLAWLLAAVAGVLPILGTLTGIEVLSKGLVASLLVGTAAALLGLDKVFGFSTGWARYVLTGTSIRRSLEQFRVDWAELMAKAGPNPTNETAQPLIERAARFRTEVENLVVQETKDWVTEFQSTMAQLEKDVAAQVASLKEQMEKNAQAASQTGAIELSIQNHAAADPGSVKVTLTDAKGNQAQAAATGPTWTRINLPPGQFDLKVEALVNGKPVPPVATVVTVEAGKIATPKVAL